MPDIVAIDFETHLIDIGQQAPPPVCLTYADAPGGPTFGAGGIIHCALEPDEATRALREWLTTPGLHIVGANIAFDLLVAANAWPDLLPLIFKAYDDGRISDVENRQKLMDIAVGEYRGREDPAGWFKHEYGLAALVKRHLKKDVSEEKYGPDSWRLRYKELEDVPLEKWPEAALGYAIGDAENTRDVWLAQEAEVAVDGIDVLFDEPAQNRADFALKLMSAWGLTTNPEAVAALRASCEKNLGEITEKLVEAGLVRKDGSRNVRATQARMISARGGLENCKLTDGGKAAMADGKPVEVKHVALDEEACKDTGDEQLEHYHEFLVSSSILNKDVKALESPLIHSRFEVLLNTGRTSSSKPYNVQNVRRLPGIRECFQPRPGYAFVGADYDKGELHSLAQVCKWALGSEGQLMQALNAGIDPHTQLGADLADCTYGELQARIEAGDDEAKEWRQRSKAGNFGIPGGMGAAGFIAYAKESYGVVMTHEQGEKVHDTFFQRWPEVGAYHTWVKSLLDATGEGNIIHFVSKRWRGRVWFTVAANSFFQGLLADAAKASLYAVSKACYLEGVDDRLFGCRPVNFLHDEIILEVPLDQVADAALGLEEAMCRVGATYTPDCPLHTSAVAMDRWSKKAKRIVSEDGRLQVWHCGDPWADMKGSTK